MLFHLLFAKRMEKAKTVVTESVPIEEVEKVVQADSKEETVQADNISAKNKIILERLARMEKTKPQKVETHRVDKDEEFNVLMSELKFNSNTTFDEASEMFNDLLFDKFGFVNEADDDKALKERFKNEWETSITVQKVEPIIEEEENPFA